MVEVVIPLVAPVAAWLGTAAWLDATGRRPPPPGPFDALVVAGCRVLPDGGPSPALARRVDLAVSLWEDGVAPRIVLTGGGSPVTEARAAAERCLARGVPAGALLLEEASRTTLENAAFAARLVRGRVLVVSDAAHAFRCRRVFRRHFPDAEAVGALATGWPRVRLALREAVAVWRHGIALRL